MHLKKVELSCFSRSLAQNKLDERSEDVLVAFISKSRVLMSLDISMCELELTSIAASISNNTVLR